MTKASAVGDDTPKRDGMSETTAPKGRTPTEGGAESEPTREEKERLDREAGDVADDLADFA